MLMEFPITGTGAGTYGQVFPMYQRIHHSVFTYAHNDYLQTVAETGLLTFLLSLVAFVRIFARLRNFLSRNFEGTVILQVGALCSLAAILFTALIHFSLQVPAIAIVCSTAAALFFANYQRRGTPSPSRD